jgi:hypothetical protein
MADSVGKIDERVMKLAHPRRYEAVAFEALKGMHKDGGSGIWERLKEAFAGERLTSDIVQEFMLDSEYRDLLTMLQASKLEAGWTAEASQCTLMFYLRHAMHPQPYFVVDDALLSALEHTAIDEHIPLSMLNLPHDRFFIEFGQGRKCSLNITSPESGQHTLEGAYLERGIDRSRGEGLFVLLTGSPVGRSSALADTTHSVFVPLADPELSIADILKGEINKVRSTASKGCVRIEPEDFITQTLDAMLLLTKSLLFMSLPEAEKVEKKDKLFWESATSGLKSAAKRDKAARKGLGLVDHVLVSCKTHSGPSPALKDLQKATVDLRLARLRLQEYGPHRVSRRVEITQPKPTAGDDDDYIAHSTQGPTLH